MSEATQYFEAYMVHPDSGPEVVAGKLRADRWRLLFQSDTSEWEIPLEHLEIKPGRGRDHRVYFRDRRHSGARIFTEDDSILACTPFAQSSLVRRQLEQIFGRRDLIRRLRLTFYFFVGCGLVAWLGSMASGAMVRALVNEIPMAWETRLGNSLITNEEARLPFLEDSNAVAQLATLAQPLVRAIHRKDIHFQFHILEDPLPNAFALPGGHIIVTTGLLRLTDRPDELLGVIAHETAHVTQRHAFRHLISGKGPGFLLQMILGGRHRLLAALAYPSEKLVYESFSQEYERDADRVGWNYLVAARINPHGMIDMFRKLRDYDADHGISRRGSAFASHPSLNRRIAWLEAKWNKLPDRTHFIKLTNAIPKINAEDLDATSLQKMFHRR